MQKIYVTLNIKGDVEKLHEIHKSARLQSLYGLPQRANRKEGNMALKIIKAIGNAKLTKK